MPVTLACRTPAAAPWRSYLRVRARHVLRALALDRYELSVAIVDDAEMRALNGRFRGRDRATDVLSFPLSEVPLGGALAPRPTCAAVPDARAGRASQPCGGSEADRLLGDVVLSIDTAARQARTSRRPLACRLDALLVHGVLHLIGYDHERSRAEARRMSRRARAVHAALATWPLPSGASAPATRGRVADRRRRRGS